MSEKSTLSRRNLIRASALLAAELAVPSDIFTLVQKSYLLTKHGLFVWAWPAIRSVTSLARN